jgi:CheY-like chemotaxis protein
LEKYRCPQPPCPVLLVEDDDVTREMMRTMLERAGWGVTEACDGREGLEAVARSAPNVILLDLMMPHMDGFEFLAELHRKPEWSAIPVIVITAKNLTEQERLRLSGSVRKVLMKGEFSRTQLMDRIRDLLRTCMPA